MNLKEIKDLIELVSEKGFAEFEIERQGFRLRVSRFQEPATQVIHPAPPPVIISPALPGTPEILPAAAHRAPALESAPSATGSQAAGSRRPEQPDAISAEPDLHVIKSPIVGTFYRAPSPNSEPFVTVGAQIEPDSVVCIIEAMKLMNEIQAEVGGEIVKIYVENGQPVEYGQPLFGVRT